MAYNQLGYKDKNVVVTGAASGMGGSVTKLIGELGAKVYALDLKEVQAPVEQFIPINLGDKASIDAAVDNLPDSIDCIFHCAGIAGTIYAGRSFAPLDVVTINFIGARYFIESLIPKLHEGSSIVIVSSIAGMNWKSHINDYNEFVHLMDWEAAQEFIMARQGDPLFIGGPSTLNKPYVFSKECVCIYMAFRSWDLAAKKIRINTVSPGATKTPMHDDFREIVGKQRGTSMPVSPIGYEAGPDQMASVMLFLNSDMADYVSGQDIAVDYALVPGMQMGRMKFSPVMETKK